VKWPARRRTAPGRDAQMRDRHVDRSLGERSARRILSEDVEQDPELERLQRHCVGAIEETAFVVRQVKLP
jgi:hypothetical protein